MSLDLSLERREFKYLVPLQQLDRIRASLQGRCRLDAYASPSGTYRVRSVYYDRADFALYRANLREQLRRFKVRARTYPESDIAPVFLEVKQRHGDGQRKTRAQVSRDVWYSGSRLATSWVSPSTSAFVDLVDRYDLQPTCLVDYQREAWFSELDDYARVTFDLDISAADAHGRRLDSPREGWLPLDHAIQTRTFDRRAVVELKFAGPAPRWMSDMVRRHELVRYAFSKYGAAVQALHADPLRRTPTPRAAS